MLDTGWTIFYRRGGTGGGGGDVRRDFPSNVRQEVVKVDDRCMREITSGKVGQLLWVIPERLSGVATTKAAGTVVPRRDIFYTCIARHLFVGALNVADHQASTSDGGRVRYCVFYGTGHDVLAAANHDYPTYYTARLDVDYRRPDARSTDRGDTYCV